jgi:hypothetical protein
MGISMPMAVTEAASASPPGFAHPVEREIARIFDEHGVAWLYEPHTFVLERNPDGTVHEAFTPDFYLPDLDLYIECTLMRQALTTRKRRKARKTREQEGVKVEVLFRQDIERLARRWELDRLGNAARRVLPCELCLEGDAHV